MLFSITFFQSFWCIWRKKLTIHPLAVKCRLKPLDWKWIQSLSTSAYCCGFVDFECLLSGTSWSSLKSYGLRGSLPWEPARTLEDNLCHYSQIQSFHFAQIIRNPHLFLPALCERWVTNTSASSSSESDSLSFLERFFSFSRTCTMRSASVAQPHHGCFRQNSSSCCCPSDLFEVGVLDELHGHLRVFQLHSFAHPGLGVRCGETDQGLQSTGSHRRGLAGWEGIHKITWSERPQLDTKQFVLPWLMDSDSSLPWRYQSPSGLGSATLSILLRCDWPPPPSAQGSQPWRHECTSSWTLCSPSSPWNRSR